MRTKQLQKSGVGFLFHLQKARNGFCDWQLLVSVPVTVYGQRLGLLLGSLSG